MLFSFNKTKLASIYIFIKDKKKKKGKERKRLVGENRV